MNTDQARDAVVRALARIAPEADLGSVDANARFRDELDLDSLDFLGLVQALQEDTGVEIPESAYRQVDTLQALLAFLVAAEKPVTAAGSRPS